MHDKQSIFYTVLREPLRASKPPLIRRIMGGAHSISYYTAVSLRAVICGEAISLALRSRG